MKIKITMVILSILLFSCDKEESKYPIELNLVKINKGEIFAYTNIDSLIESHNYVYEDVYYEKFDNFEIKKIKLLNEKSAKLIFGENEFNNDTVLNYFPATIDYVYDSIIFYVNENYDGFYINFNLHGIDNENSITIFGTAYAVFMSYGINHANINNTLSFDQIKKHNMETFGNHIKPTDTIAYYHYTQTYEQ